MKRLLSLVGLSVGVAFIAVACGGGDDPTPTATPAAASTPVTDGAAPGPASGGLVVADPDYREKVRCPLLTRAAGELVGCEDGGTIDLLLY